MITAIIVLSILALKDNIISLIDLYSTLQGNKVVVGIVTFIGVTTALFEMRLVSVYEGSWFDYIIVVIIVGIAASFSNVFLIGHKNRLKEMLRKKKISRSVKAAWERKKNEQSQASSTGTEKLGRPVQHNVQEAPKHVPPEATDNPESCN